MNESPISTIPSNIPSQVHSYEKRRDRLRDVPHSAQDALFLKQALRKTSICAGTAFELDLTSR